MLTYTFSQREKIMIALLAVVLIAVLWYKFIFEGVQSQLSSLDVEIANAQDELVISNYKVANIKQIEGRLERYRNSGASMKVMPTYDNIRPLSASLNATLQAATTYTLRFDEIGSGSKDSSGGEGAAATSNDAVQRGVTLSFDCDSYATVRTILSALVEGEFPCTIDSLSITDNTVRNGTRTSASTGSAVSATAHLTFYEKLSAAQIQANAQAAAAAAAAEAEAAAAE